MTKIKNQLRELLANYAHEAWSGWMDYLFGKCTVNRQGDCVIPCELYKRWYRQLTTPYADLPNNEKESDRYEADRMIEIYENSIVLEHENYYAQTNNPYETEIKMLRKQVELLLQQVTLLQSTKKIVYIFKDNEVKALFEQEGSNEQVCNDLQGT